jgi:hypothetical protein
MRMCPRGLCHGSSTHAHATLRRTHAPHEKHNARDQDSEESNERDSEETNENENENEVVED